MSVKAMRATRIGAAAVLVAGSAWIFGQAAAVMLVVHVVDMLLHPVIRSVAQAG